jgi:hypothetical protein
MGAVYDSYTIANLPADLKGVTVDTPEGPKSLVERDKIPNWVPPTVAERLYPAGGERLRPVARESLEKQAKTDPALKEKFSKVEQAEAQGAAWSYRWTTVLPCVLVVIFGLIALIDKIRGGYKAVHITDGHAPAPAAARPKGPKGTDYGDWSRE